MTNDHRREGKQKFTLAGWLPPPVSGTNSEMMGSVGDQLKSIIFSTFKDFLSTRENVSVS